MAARERRPSGDSQKSMDSCPRRPRSAAAEWLRTQALLTPIRKIIRLLLRFLPERNFITVHYAYFIFTCLLSAVIFWGSSTSAPVSFIDALFLCSSAMTEAGLNTVNLSRLNTWQQFMLMGLIIIGSAIWVSAFVVFARLQAFQHNFADVIKRRQQTARSRRQQNSSRTGSLVSGQKLTMLPLSTKDLSGTSSPLDDASGSDAAGDKQAASPRTHVNQDLAGLDLRRVSFGWSKDSDGGRPYLKDLIDSNLESGVSSLHHARPSSSSSRRVQQSHRTKQHSVFSFTGIGAIATSNLRPRSSAKRRSSPYAETNSIPLNAERTSAWFPSKAGYFMRNSQVHGLSAGERRELGGREYSAVKFLSVIVPVYFILMQLLGSIGLAAWVAYHRPDTARANGMNPWWVGAFNGISAFNNSGMSLLDANMVAFQDSVYMLCTMGFLILAGNTAYPCFLRLIIWTMWKLLPANDDAWADERANLRFLLDHPRRCYTNLFPARHTWWLAGAVVVLNSIDWAAFELLNIGNDKITSLPNGTEVLAGLFQALAVRSGGFYVVPITSTRVSLQVLYVIMMYISAYPVTITMRHSNVYEERSLGIYADDLPADPSRRGTLSRLRRRMSLSTRGEAREHNSAFVRHQLRAQLAHDAWVIALAVFAVCVIEGAQFERDPVAFSVLNVIFEIVSGYGCVGISVGVPDDAYSFCGSWHALSKLVLVGVMLRGRHRGLPVAIDHAVQVPGDEEEWEVAVEDGEEDRVDDERRS